MTDESRSLVHEAASSGFTSSSGEYVRGRPAYASDSLSRLVELFGGGIGPVADVGAGAGMMSNLLSQAGVAVVAVEPLEAMLAQMPSSMRPVRAVAGELPIASGALTGVVAAQSFHWFSTSSVLQEFHRVLRPGATLALVWNERDPRTDWVARYDSIVDHYAGDTPRFMNLAWQRAFVGFDGFTQFSYEEYPNPVPSSRAGVLARALSTSFIAALPDQQRAEVAAAVQAVTQDLPEQFEFPYSTRMWLYRRSS